jgi:MFS family permease
VPALLRRPGVLPLLALNILARVPLAGCGVLLVVHGHAITGSYAAAGAVAAANGLTTALAAPVLGRLVDRRGQTLVLVASGLACGGALLAVALLPRGAPVLALVALAAVAGAVQPPLGACLRTLWPDVMGGDPRLVASAFSLEAATLELTYIAGPLGFLTLAALTSTRVSVGALGGLLAVGTLAFAAQPPSRAWRPVEHGSARRRSALGAPAIQTIAVVMALVGVLVGGVEVAIAAASNGAHHPGATGPLLAVWGIGSLLGGVAAARRGGPEGARGLVLVLLALAVTHAVLALSASTAILGALLVLAGFGIAPLFGQTSALTGRLALPGTSTEAFAWTTTAVSAGAAIGAALAGAIADSSTPAAFAVAASAGLIAAAFVAARASSLQPA